MMDFQKHAEKITGIATRFNAVVSDLPDFAGYPPLKRSCLVIQAIVNRLPRVATLMRLMMLADYGTDEDATGDVAKTLYVCAAMLLWALATLDRADVEPSDPGEFIPGAGDNGSFEDADPGVLYTADGGEQ